MDLTKLQIQCWKIACEYNDFAWELGKINEPLMKECNQRIAEVSFLRTTYRKETQTCIGHTSKKYRVRISDKDQFCTCPSFVFAGKKCKHIDALAMRFLAFSHGVKE